MNTNREITTNYKRAVGVFERREDVESALRALKDKGFNMDNVSLLARDIEGVEGADQVTDKEGNEASEGAGIGATTGTVLGGIGGFLVGAGVLAIPGVGPVLAAGVGISEIASTLAGAGIGAAAGGIVGALVGLGIPEEKAKVYEDRIKAGDYLLMVTGTEDEVESAASILRDRDIQEFEIYDAPDRYQADNELVEQPRPMAEREEVVSERREVSRRDATDKIDIDNDNEAEVFIVDETKKNR
ncbi:general stress protein [Myxosarcina sp. GI1(2024)]